MNDRLMTFGMNRIRPVRRFALGLLAAVACLAPIDPASAAAKDGETFGDWRVRCQSAPEGAASPPCFIFQTVVETDKEQEIMRFLVAYPPGQASPRAIIILPLGIALQAGIELSIDGGAAKRSPFISCFQDGCQSHIALDDTVLGGFKRGLKGTVAFRTLPDGRGVKLPISLKGFTAALKSLR